MSAKISVKFEGVLKDLQDFKQHVRRNAEFGAEKALKRSLPKLKKQLNEILETEKNKTVAPSDQEEYRKLKLPRTKQEVLQNIFGDSIKGLGNLNKPNLKVVQEDDNSNVFYMKNGILKAKQTWNEGTPFPEELIKFRKRLENGIIVDIDSGKVYLPEKRVLGGIKIECSTDRGDTDDSRAKFDRNTTGSNVTRRKDGARVNTWTIKQQDLKLATDKALDLDDIVEDILQENYSQAVEKMLDFDPNSKVIENINNISKTVPTEIKAIQEIQKLVNNLKIEKEITDKKVTRYILVTFYADEEKTVNFLEEVKQKVNMWITVEQPEWFMEILKQVTTAIAKYDQSKVK